MLPSRRVDPSYALLRFSSEVFPIHPRQRGEERGGRELGAQPGRACSQLGWSSTAVRVRSAEDGSLEVAEEWRGHGMKSGLRLRHAGDRHRGGVVLASAAATKRDRREPGGFREILLLQSAALPR